MAGLHPDPQGQLECPILYKRSHSKGDGKRKSTGEGKRRKEKRKGNGSIEAKTIFCSYVSY